MKKLFGVILIIFLFLGAAFAVGSLDSAYKQAAKEAGVTTASLVENLDLEEFESHFGLSLSEEDEQLIRIALMAYSNGAMLEHPAGINDFQLTSLTEDTYVGNKSSKKFHYSWCSSVSDMKEKNKITFNSRDEAVSKGYKPCKRCNP